MGAVKIGTMRLTRLPLEALTDFQGRFKGLAPAALLKLEGELRAQGLSAVVTVWRRGKECLILDGHQRVAALRSLQAKGVDVPALPVVEIQAKDEKDARAKVLTLASVHGRVDGAGLAAFLKTAALSLDDAETRFQFPDFDFKEFRRLSTQGQKGGSNESQGSQGEGGTGAALGQVTCPRCRRSFKP